MIDIIKIDKLNFSLCDLVLLNDLYSQINGIFNEYLSRNKITLFDIDIRRKFLFVGPYGTGKTMAALALAKELKLPAYMIADCGSIHEIFEIFSRETGVYIFDAGYVHFVRNEALLNSLKFEASNSLIFFETRYSRICEYSCFFDDIIYFSRPTKENIRDKLEDILSPYLDDINILDNLSGMAYENEFGFVDVVKICNIVLRKMIMRDSKLVDKELLCNMFAKLAKEREK